MQKGSDLCGPENPIMAGQCSPGLPEGLDESHRAQDRQQSWPRARRQIV